ncbi:hypothetical protein H4K36_32585 [Streptomyces sp. DHE7-1]|uniref:hypothetical protein n=1 Tax=Streptomyces sp. NPDC093248 TaxID=3155072 RepID=UPI0018EE7A44|nr:hypothetical protein [Streptomyces sp. DHE7-1]
MDHRKGARRQSLDSGAEGSGQVSNDRERTRERRSAVGRAAVPLLMLLLVDWGSGRLALWRTVSWLALAVLLFVVLCPPRVSAGGNWLASRGLVREQRVRTDLLVSIRVLDGISQRLLLRDSQGGRVEIDPEVLLRNPQLWLRLNEGAQKAAADGLLLCGQTALRRLAARMDRETARAVFKASGLD